MGRAALIAGFLFGGAALAAPSPGAKDGAVRGTVKLVLVTQDGKRQPLPDASSTVAYFADFEQAAAENSVGGQIEQRNKTFVPDVLPIVKGQSVTFLNDDPFLHNVFSNSRAAGRNGMDLGKYKGPGASKSWTFTRTGVVDLYCDIHESMVASILVLPNPAFRQPKADGTFEIDHVPAGHHVLYVWARHGALASTDVDIQPGQVAVLPPIEVLVTQQSDEHLDAHKQSYSRHVQGYGN